MTMSNRFKVTIKSALHGLGVVLGLLGIVFVAQRLWEYKNHINLAQFSNWDWIGIAVLSLVAASANVLLVLGWQRILAHLRTDVSFRWAFKAYATSLLAKYVPGNIFQFLGRHAIGLAAGLNNATLGKSTVLELALIAAVGSLFCPMILPIIWPTVDAASALIFCAALLSLGVVVLGNRFGKQLVTAALLHILFLVTSGIIFVEALNIAEAPTDIAKSTVVAGCYVLAWLAGLLTPGAPAGLGVREAVLVFLLSGLSPEPVILLAVVIGRAITVLGDLMFFLAGLWLNPSR